MWCCRPQPQHVSDSFIYELTCTIILSLVSEPLPVVEFVLEQGIRYIGDHLYVYILLRFILAPIQ